MHKNYIIMELLILRIISFITSRRIILLTDAWGKEHITIECKSSNSYGSKKCHVYWNSKIGDVILNQDGTTSGATIYIKKWEYID